MKKLLTVFAMLCMLGITAMAADTTLESVSVKDPLLGLTWVLPGAQMTGTYYCNLIKQDDGQIGQTFTGLESLLIPIDQYKVDIDWGVMFPATSSDPGSFTLSLNKSYTTVETKGILSSIGVPNISIGLWGSKMFNGTWDKGWLAGFKSSVLFWGPKQK